MFETQTSMRRQRPGRLYAHATGLVLTLLVIAATPAWAEEGRIPLFEPTVLNGALGDITGTYVVTENITSLADEPAIEVIGTGTERIEIDLNGFELKSARTGAAVEAGAVIQVSNVGSIKIRNGSVLTSTLLGNQGNGVSVLDSKEVLIEDVSVADAFIGIEVKRMELFAVRRCFVNRTDSSAMFIDGGGVLDSLGTIENNLITNTDSISVQVKNLNGGTFANNKVYSGNNGVSVSSCNGTLIEDNVIADTVVGYGLRLDLSDACQITGNVIRNSQSSGLILAGGLSNNITDNVIIGNVQDGIKTNANSGRHIIERNLVSGNGTNGTSSGIRIESDRNLIRNNNVTDNGGRGIWLWPTADGNTLGDNSSQGNLGSAAACVNIIGACTSPDFCDDSTSGTNQSFGTNLMPGGC